MTQAPRAPLRIPPAIPIAIISVCLVFFIWAFFPIFRLTGQYFAVAAVLLGFRYWPPMIRLVSRMPVLHRVVFGLIIGGMILGHLTIRPRAYFPFIPWYIFPAVREDDPVTCRELIATTASGHQVRLLVEQLFPSIVQINPLDSFTPEATDRLVRTLAKAYNEHHPDDPVQQVDLMVMAVKLHPPATESRTEPSCEFLKRYNFSSGL